MYEDSIRVWDPFVRIAHWTIVAGFAVAYLTEDDLLSVHVWAGYVVGAAVILRILWGFVGPRHARFSDFVYSPVAVLLYLRDLVTFHARRYLGHSPAGGAMVVLLLLGLVVTVSTGLATYGIDKKAGPLAPLFATQAAIGTDEPADAVATKEQARDEENAIREAHEFFANFTLLLAILHVSGVALASVVHRENLVLGMITGRKRASGAEEGVRGGSAVGR